MTSKQTGLLPTDVCEAMGSTVDVRRINGTTERMFFREPITVDGEIVGLRFDRLDESGWSDVALSGIVSLEFAA